MKLCPTCAAPDDDFGYCPVCGHHYTAEGRLFIDLLAEELWKAKCSRSGFNASVEPVTLTHGTTTTPPSPRRDPYVSLITGKLV